MMGKEYLIDHVLSEYKSRNEKQAFEYYCSELLRSLNNSVARTFGGAEFKKSFKEMLNYKPETRTPEEIKGHMLSKFKQLGDNE